MGVFKRSRNEKSRQPLRLGSRGRFERLEDRWLMAIVTDQSTFDASLFGDNLEDLIGETAVGYGYSVNQNGVTAAAFGSGGLDGGKARTIADLPERDFTAFTKTEIASVSKTITATAVLKLLQSQPGGLDAALSTPLADYLPSDWDPGANVGFVTLRHLLTHRGGFSESANPIGVEFESFGNNTFQNLKNLVEAGLSAPNVATDAVYDGPRWSYSYNNANFSLLAKVVIPKLLNPGLDLTANNFGNLDQTTGNAYKQYVQDNVFEPLGIVGDLAVTDVNPAKGYALATAESSPGYSQSNMTNTGGAFGWKLSAVQLSIFLDGLRNDNSILWASTRNTMNDQQLGWFSSSDAFGAFYSHNGAAGSSGGREFNSMIAAMPGDVEASFVMNSDNESLPDSIGNLLKTSYVNAWTDLTFEGTSGSDNFLLRIDNSGDQSEVEVLLGGVVQFSHWVSTLDSLIINGLGGNDVFTIDAWPASIELVINGEAGNDQVLASATLGNLEAVRSLEFNGGSGTDSITLNDENNPYSSPALSRVYYASSTGVARYMAGPIPQVPFLPVAVSYSGVENLTLTTGEQTDVVHVTSTTSGETIINTGAGADTLIASENDGNLELVRDLTFNGGSGADSLVLNDENNPYSHVGLSRLYSVTASSVFRYAALPQNPAIPVPVGIEFNGVEDLELTTGGQTDVIRVSGTTSGETTINAGAGDDVLLASEFDGNLEQVRDLTFNGGTGSDRLVLNDENNPYSNPAMSRLYFASSASVLRYTASPIPQLPFLPVVVNYAGVENLELTTGELPDIVRVASTTSGETIIRTGAGADILVASESNGNLEQVRDLTFDGGAGTDSLVLNDENNPYSHPGLSRLYSVTPTGVFRYAAHPTMPAIPVGVSVQFEGVEDLTLHAGDGADLINIGGASAEIALTIHGNEGADAFNVNSPAFATMEFFGGNPQPDPDFVPDDLAIDNPPPQMDVLNIDAEGPAVATHTPDAAGAGEATLDDTMIVYAEIEQVNLNDPLPTTSGDYFGDFDGNGAVNGDDLTHPTLGWRERFGVNLDGGDFLTWQRNFGARVPADEQDPLTAPVGDLAAPTPLQPAPADRLAPYAQHDETFAGAFIAEPTTHEASAATAAGFHPTRRHDLVDNFYAAGQTSVPLSTTGKVAQIQIGTTDERLVEETEPTPANWALDEAFAEFGTLLSVAG